VKFVHSIEHETESNDKIYLKNKLFKEKKR